MAVKRKAVAHQRNSKRRCNTEKVLQAPEIQMMRKTDAPQQTTRKTTFFSLPAELRNRIYDLALIHPEEVKVTKRFKEPSILQSHPQIRHEARKLYYRNNTFRAPIQNCDATLLVAFNKLIRQFADETGSVRLRMKLTGRKDWAGIVKWCEQIHKYRLHCWYWTNPDKTRMEAVIEAAHKVVRVNGRSSWAKCRAGLQALGEVVARYDPAWMKPSKGGRK